MGTITEINPLMLKAAAGGGTLWTPTQLGASVIAWYYADSANMSLTGSAVNSWNDISGNSLTLTTGGGSPTYSATARNSLPGVTFNGTSDYMATASSSLFPQGTAAHGVMIVAYHASDDGTFHPILAWGQMNFQQLRMEGTNTNNVGQFGYGSDHTSGFSWSNLDHIDIAMLASGSSPTSTIYVENSSTSSTATLTDRANTDSALYVGANPGLELANCAIQEIVICDRVFTTTEVGILQGYAAWNWGQQANLYSGHPYASGPPYV